MATRRKYTIADADAQSAWHAVREAQSTRHDPDDFDYDLVVTRDFLGWSRIERIPAKIYHQV